MRQLKKYVLVVSVGSELLLFCYVLVFGSQGTLVLAREGEHNHAIAARIVQTVDQNKELEQQLHNWRHTAFEMERYAREKLHLARPDETIYYMR